MATNKGEDHNDNQNYESPLIQMHQPRRLWTNSLHWRVQGRRIGYHDPAHIIIKRMKARYSGDTNQLGHILTQAQNGLNSKPPSAWVVSSLLALVLVWLEAGMRSMISDNIPTVGIRCRSGPHIIYGIFSIVPWFPYLLECLGLRGRLVFNWLSYLFLALSVAEIRGCGRTPARSPRYFRGKACVGAYDTSLIVEDLATKFCGGEWVR
jgi:hypothetical protein